MIIKRIDSVSCAKIMGLLYAALGLLLGCLMAIVLPLGRYASGVPWAPGTSGLFGVGIIIFFPITYGAIGFVLTWIAVSFYNILAGVVGGVKVEIAPLADTGWNALGQTRITDM